jgi:2,3-bisphosphoglycerate-independent phosphoglycerate mutase
MNDAKTGNAALHILGLLSDGGVHSHITHLFAILRMAKMRGLDRVFFHCFLDGRDTGPRTGARECKSPFRSMRRAGSWTYRNDTGPLLGMDRDKRWDRLQKGYDAIVRGEGVLNPDPVAAVQISYSADVTDEFVVPVVCDRKAGLKAETA